MIRALKDFDLSAKIMFLVGALFFVFGAYNTPGYFHPDEHFQIIEFANFKLNNTPVGDLPWEYGEKMRPALQPALCFMFLQLFDIVGISSPFTQAMILRMLSGLLMLFLSVKFYHHFRNEFSSPFYSSLLLALPTLLWFMPMVGVRFSSEVMSTVAFMLGTSLLMADNTSKSHHFRYGIVGVLFGLSFFFRFQIAFALLGFGAWLIFIRKLEVSKLAWLIIFGLITGGIGVIIDYWFYGEWVLTPYNYFHSNIVDDKASTFGVSPWWGYVSKFIIWGIPPISVPLLFFFLIGFRHNLKHPFVWVFTFFFIGHSLVAHKELRFMIPVVFCFLFLVIKGMEQLDLGRFVSRLSTKIFIGVLFVINLIALVAMLFIPIEPVFKNMEYLYERSCEGQAHIMTQEVQPFIRTRSKLKANFYIPQNITVVSIENEQDIIDYMTVNNLESVYLVHSQIKEPPRFSSLQPVLSYSFLPNWFIENNYFGLVDQITIWQVYQLRMI